MAKRILSVAFLLSFAWSAVASANEFKKNWAAFEEFDLEITSGMALRKGALVLEITKRDQTYEAFLIDKWNDTRTAVTPKSGWEKLLSTIEDLEILYLPGSHGLKHREDVTLDTNGNLGGRVVLDGVSYSVLYRFKLGRGFARKYAYENPCHYKRDDARKFCQIIEFINKEFGVEYF